MSTRERNAEITRRRLAGERPSDLGLEFGITPERVWQIVQAEQRRQRGEPPARRQRGVAPTVPLEPPRRAEPFAVRPRLRKAASGLWECSCGQVARAAASPADAYSRWLTASIADAQPKAQPPVPPTPPAAPKTEDEVSRAIAGYRGDVEIVKGAPARKPLSFASRLGLNLERVGQAQPPVQSLAGARSPRNGGFHDQE
ncbi:hypothetical protein [Achromobacter sp.]|uniref:hypothetical protein n=1 Tax=Achromobacter sp. TaxID=134375 RepID=UPI0028A718E1|nr:hypothetical protein [Achromobacter sp.]